MKEIVFLFDGTSMSLKTKSNISKLHCLFKYGELYVENEEDFETKNPFVVYQEGAGSIDEKISGELYGHGSFSNVKQSYREFSKILKSVKDEFKVAIFGYSRGAYAARLFAHLISDCGLPEDLSDCDKTADKYLEKRNIAPLENKFEIKEIAVLGLFDTVRANLYSHPKDLKLPSRVARCYHAMSLDEERMFFNLLKFEDVENKEKIESAWFAGVHSDIGGSDTTKTEFLSNITLNWMIENVKKEKFTLPEIHLAQNPFAEITENETLPDTNKRTYAKGEEIHKSVYDRIAHFAGDYTPNAKNFPSTSKA